MIQEKELQKLQKLAKLNFTKKELHDFSHKLNSVLEMIDSLKNVDCSSVEPLRSLWDMDQRTREDEVKEPDISDNKFKNIPDNGSDFAKEIKCFVVPKMIK